MNGVRRALARGAAILVSAALCVVCAHRQAEAGDVKAGRAKADKCAVCHGLDGLAKIPEAPNLAGQNERYLIEQLSAFKSGMRQNEMMSIIIAEISPQDIEDLAAYYAAIQITVGKMPGE